MIEPLVEALRQSQPPCLVYLAGSEGYLVDRALELLKTTLLDPNTAAFNYESLQATELSPASVIGKARTLPMFAAMRLIVVRDAGEWKADEANFFLPYIENPNPQTCLCLISASLDQRTKLATAWKKRGLLLKLDPPTDRQLPAFIRAESTRLHIKLGPGVVDRLVDDMGPNLQQLHQTLWQLSCFVSGRDTVTIEDVDAVVTSTKQHSVFALIDALGQKNRATSLRRLNELLATKEPALKILSLIVRQIRLLWRTCGLLHKNTSTHPAQIASQLGVAPFLAGKLLDQAKLFTLQDIEQLHEQAYQTDRLLKQSKIEDVHHLENLVLQFCPAQARRHNTRG